MIVPGEAPDREYELPASLQWEGTNFDDPILQDLQSLEAPAAALSATLDALASYETEKREIELESLKKAHSLKNSQEVLKLQKVHLECKREELKNKRRELELDLREHYSKYIYGLVCAWLALIFFLLGLQGCQHVESIDIGSFKFAINERKFVLSDNVLMALIGGTTASLISLFAIVASHIFPKGVNKKADEKKAHKSESEKKEPEKKTGQA